MSAVQNVSPPSVQEYSIRVPKNSKKKYHVMRFNYVLNVDFSKWTQVKMERENNLKEFLRPEDEQPRFGAGSEFGREAKEEARRKKYGIVSKKYRPEDQPWILKAGGKTGKKFKGIREGGVAENAAFYVFTHAANGAIEAYPLNEWYNFQPINRYKALSAEEAEQEFGRRNKVMNFFSLMLRKRLRNDEDGELEDGEEGKTKRSEKKSKDFKISDMDDWVDSDEDESLSDEENNEEQKEKKNKKKKNAGEGKKGAKKKANSDDSAVEESDDGDEEGRELDYISDSSDSESDREAKVDKEMKGVAEETALRRLLTSDEEEEEEENEENKKTDTEEAQSPEEVPPTSSSSKKKKKKTPKKEKEDVKGKDGKEDDSSSDFSPDSSDSEDTKTKLLPTNSANSSRCGSPVVGEKRPFSGSDVPPIKKPRVDSASLNFSNSETGITEEAVRRYLMRKPMTTTELLQKFKCKKTGLSSEQLVNVMTQILKKINPVKQTIKNKMYLSIKHS